MSGGQADVGQRCPSPPSLDVLTIVGGLSDAMGDKQRPRVLARPVALGITAGTPHIYDREICVRLEAELRGVERQHRDVAGCILKRRRA